MKTLNVGLIGYGFMGRAHSNAYRKVNNFFDLEYQPVLKAVCARDEAKAKAFADKWGYESVETDWRQADRAQGYRRRSTSARPNNLHAEIAIAAAKAGQDDPVRKAAVDGRQRRREDGRGRREGRECRTWFGTTTAACRPSRSPSSSSTKAGSGRSSITARTSCRTGRSRADLPQGGAALWRLDVKAAGSAASRATCSRTASTRRSGSTARSTPSPR